MNDTQKSLIILGLLFILLGLAQHFLFVQRLGSQLIVEQAEFQLQELSEIGGSQVADSLTFQDELRISTLKTRVKWAKSIQYLFLIGCIPCFVMAYIFRTQKSKGDFDDEWEDEEWDDDE